jgi:Ser/Thr protein kinase RdoA (MazF antagonist)
MLTSPIYENLKSVSAIRKILADFDIPVEDWLITSFGNGLINRTWKVGGAYSQKHFILQRINQDIFRRPKDIADNMAMLGEYLRVHHPDYLFIQPIPTREGKPILQVGEEGWFRLLPFVNGSHTIDIVSKPDEAYEAALQFGRFTRLLQYLPPDKLHITLPHFHDLLLRYQQFEKALLNADYKTRQLCKQEIELLLSHRNIVKQFELIQADLSFPQRIIHHDTKISNCLFNDEQKGLCVIDLDTVMPGYFISDVGDMCRSYLSNESEESVEFDNIEIRLDYFNALAEGYLEEMGDVLTQKEIEKFTFSGKFLIYMQALRFLSDFLNGNPYYPVSYPLHNLNRAKNQISLLNNYCTVEPQMQKIVRNYLGKNFK